MRPRLSLLQRRFTGNLFITTVALTALAVSCTVQGTGSVPGDGDGDSDSDSDSDGPGGSTSGDGDGDQGSGGRSGEPECEDGDDRPCNDCGRQVCDADTLSWGACEPAAEPTCLEDGEREVCDESGYLVTEECENDETNCSVSCEDIDGVGTCVYKALDSDDDGYASAACAAAPGDDCDDTTNLVSPTSVETCDGRDNDCDGHTDAMDESIDLMGDDVRIGGTNTSLPSFFDVDITWHDGEFFFASAADDRAIYSGRAAISGTAALNPDPLFGSSSDTVHNSIRVASSGNDLAAIVAHDGRSGAGLGFSLLNPSGTVIQEFGSLGASHQGEITSDGNNFFLAAISGSTGVTPNFEFHHLEISADNERSGVVGREDMPGSIKYANAARANGATAVVYTDTSEESPSVQLMRASGDALQGPLQLADAAQMGDVTALASGNFAFAWATADGFDFQIRRSNGTTVVCSADAEFGDGTLDEMDSVAIAQSDLGILVLAADSGGEVGQMALFVFDEECALLSEAGDELYYASPGYDYHDNELPYLPRIAVGDGHIALAWTAELSNDATKTRVYVRVMPETMCEE